MLKEIHGHIVNELQQNAKTDTIFVVAAVLFNLVVLGINWGVASEASRGNNTGQNDFILGLLIFGTVLINIIATRALVAGRTSREKLLLDLKQMYQDNDVAKYYDDDLIGTYNARYTLFTLVLLVRALLDETATSGRQYEAVWDGQDLTGRAVASGVYLARLQVGNWQATRTVTMVK